MRNLRRVVAVIWSLQAIAIGCYSPNIAPGSFACGPDGGCPDKFQCASNHRCYQGDAGLPPACNSVTTVQPISSTFCSKAAASGLCNPICQTGCNNCGWCAVSGSAATCLTGTAGKKDVGTTCDPSKNSDCLPGLYCQPETCGTVTTGSCYRLCDPSDATNSVCGAMSACTTTAKKSGGATLPFKLCSLVCDLVSQANNTNCAPPFGCYPSLATTTECDCAGTANTGDPCILADTCVPGDTCVGPSGSTICRPICTATVACASGTCSIPNGATSGTCM